MKRTTILKLARRAVLLAALAFASALMPGCGTTYAVIDSDETMNNWHQARYFQAQGRYELAREHYLLALSASRTDDVRAALGDELNAVDRQIKTLR
jgi:hypothetical protein